MVIFLGIAFLIKGIALELCTAEPLVGDEHSREELALARNPLDALLHVLVFVAVLAQVVDVVIVALYFPIKSTVALLKLLSGLLSLDFLFPSEIHVADVGWNHFFHATLEHFHFHHVGSWHESVAQAPLGATLEVHGHCHRAVGFLFGCEEEVASVESLCVGVENKAVLVVLGVDYFYRLALVFLVILLSAVDHIALECGTAHHAALRTYLDCQRVVLKLYYCVLAGEIGTERRGLSILADNVFYSQNSKVLRLRVIALRHSKRSKIDSLAFNFHCAGGFPVLVGEINALKSYSAILGGERVEQRNLGTCQRVDTCAGSLLRGFLLGVGSLLL